MISAIFTSLAACAVCADALARHGKQITAATPALASELIDHFIVVPEHNLLFCFIEKVACTNFNDLFRYLRARYDPSQERGDTWKRNTPEKHGVTKDMIEAMMINESWHKAVFYREPLERFASAYASKCLGADRDGPRHCEGQFGYPTLSFSKAVWQIEDFDEHGGSDDNSFDVHFKRQSDFCGGLSNTVHHYDTVEELDRNTANAKVSALLQKVGVDPSSIAQLDELFPPSDDDTTTTKHNTDTSDNLESYYNGSWLTETVIKHYRPDSLLFNISAPDLPRYEINHKASLDSGDCADNGDCDDFSISGASSDHRASDTAATGTQSRWPLVWPG